MALKKADYPNLYLDPASGIYHVRKMVRGRSRTRSTGQTTLKMAIAKVPRILVELADQAEAPKTVPTLDAWWKAYREAKQKSPRTWKREEEIMEQHWLPQLGKLRLDEITASQIGRCLNWRRKKVAEGTVTREQSLLHAVFEAAIDEDLIEKNPMRKIPRMDYKTRKRVVTPVEQAKVEAQMTPHVKRWFQFLLATGIRSEEVRGIRPATDIDWEGRRFRVTGKGHNGVPKERWVPMLPTVAEALESLLKAQIAENEGDPKHHRMNRKGTLWAQTASELRKRLYNACDAAGVARFGPHTLRHTFATRYLQGGGDIYILSKILGHADVGITEKVYAHLKSEDLAARSAHVQLGVG